MTIRFDWDPFKAAVNERKHGIDFDTAVLVFSDPFVLMSLDRVEDGEQRWQSLGMASGYLMLLVIHTIREVMDDGDEIEVIRIISARKADRSEKRRYENEAR